MVLFGISVLLVSNIFRWILLRNSFWVWVLVKLWIETKENGFLSWKYCLYSVINFFFLCIEIESNSSDRNSETNTLFDWISTKYVRCLSIHMRMRLEFKWCLSFHFYLLAPQTSLYKCRLCLSYGQAFKIIFFCLRVHE